MTKINYVYNFIAKECYKCFYFNLHTSLNYMYMLLNDETHFFRIFSNQRPQRPLEKKIAKYYFDIEYDKY